MDMYISTEIKTSPAKNADVTETYAIKTANRGMLIKYVNSLLAGRPMADAYLYVSIDPHDIGHPRTSAEYKTAADIPEHSVPCGCGNPNHWLIKYTDELESAH